MNRIANRTALKGGLSALVLAVACAGCANIESETAAAPSPTGTAESARIGAASGAGIQTGLSTAQMSALPAAPAYTTPTPAPGASDSIPPHAPSSTPAAAQAAAPSPVPAQAAAPAARPSPAPTPAPAAAAPAPVPAQAQAGNVDRAAGRALFSDWSCGACHALADAGGTGHVGPAFDGNARLTRDHVVAIVTNGQGAMPAFAGQLTDDEIATLAAYIVAAKK